MKKIFIIIMMVVTFISSGCSISSSYQQSIYSDDEKIVKQGDSYTFTKRIGYAKENDMSLSYKEFSGKQLIWEIAAEKDTTLNIVVDSHVKNGEFKVCLINQDLKVMIVAENTSEWNVKLPVTKGKYKIVIVGNKASGEVDIAIEENESLSIEVNE